MNPDLTYFRQGLFTSFIPVTSAGENAWREIAAQTGGTGKVFTAQLPMFLREIRKAGYSVSMAAKTSHEETAKDIDSILEELEREEA